MQRKIRLMKILDLTHRDAAGRVIMRSHEILNVLHRSGEEFMLGVLFAGVELPSYYYMGLDSRDSTTADESIAALDGKEPNSNGYERQSVDPADFDLSLGSDGSWRANGPTVVFRAVGGSWGPVKNIFLCTGLGYSSPKLISSASIGQNLLVSDGDTVTMRMAMALSGC